jgi:hypothetical protein
VRRGVEQVPNAAVAPFERRERRRGEHRATPFEVDGHERDAAGPAHVCQRDAGNAQLGHEFKVERVGDHLPQVLGV